MKDSEQLLTENADLLEACKMAYAELLHAACRDDPSHTCCLKCEAVKRLASAIVKAEPDYPHQGDLHNQEETPAQRIKRETKELFHREKS